MSDATGPTDDEIAAGQLLAREREHRALSVDEVTRALLLSKSQVEGLEQARPSAFYNHHFYRQALRKYAAYLKVTLPELPAPAPAPAPVLAEAPPSESFEAPASRRPLVLAGLALLALVVAGGGWFVIRGRGTDAAPAAVAPVATTLPVAAPVADVPAVPASPAPVPEIPQDLLAAEAAAPVVPAAEPTAASAGGAVGIVTVDDPSWLFIRYADGTVVQRGLNPGEQFALTQRMVYLAAGTPTLHLTLADRMIDMRAFVTAKGEVRVSSRQMDGWPFPDVPASVPTTASLP